MLGKRKIRKNTLGLIFGYDFNKDESYQEYYEKAYDNFCCEDDEEENVKNKFFGICENIDAIDAKISEFLQGWNIDRLSKTTLSIMRVSVYEMLYTDLPHPISINEAVELAKEYAEDGASTYINGVLNRISKSGKENA